MLRKASEFIGHTIHATDGEIGSVSTIYFDDERWTVRYLVVDTGKWLPGRKVLVSPIAVRQARWSSRGFDVSLTREQIKNGPDIDTRRPVSRQHEANYSMYYGYPYYWGGAGLWGAGGFPTYLARTEAVREMEEARAKQQALDREDAHLRDVQTVKGYHLKATDGEIGHVDDFLVEDESWAIRYLVVDTSNWLGGRHVLVSPGWVESVSWEESRVHVLVTRQAVKDSPEYVAAGEVTRQYEEDLHAHYGRAGYWSSPAAASATEPRNISADFGRLVDYDDLEIADGEPDVRGWRVVASDGLPIGTVEHLIVNRASMEVRYLEVDMQQSAGSRSRELIPIEQVDLDKKREQVRLSAKQDERLDRTPRDPRLDSENR